MYKIGVLGAGTWGVALARMLSNSGNEVTVWSKFDEEVKELSETRRHKNLKGMVIPQSVVFTTDIKRACLGKDVVVFAVPSIFVRSTAREIAEIIPDGQVIVDVAKGIEAETGYTLTKVIQSEIKKSKSGKRAKKVKLVALSGPTHAEEVALDMPTAIVSASKDVKTAELVQDVFMNDCMRVYTNKDVKGVELCGALKNIIALASGISAGLGYGDNARSALITRGMIEIARLGREMGCKERTFSGLAGIGDLIVTATSMHSRNNRAGILIGQGKSVDEALKEVGMVVEGINALPAAKKLAEKYKVETPIIDAVDAIVKGEITPAEAVKSLMRRERKCEHDKYYCKAGMKNE